MSQREGALRLLQSVTQAPPRQSSHGLRQARNSHAFKAVFSLHHKYSFVFCGPIMSMQELVSGQLRLVKVNSSRISDLRPGSQVFVLSALSAQRKILGQFHNVKSVQADTVCNLSTSVRPSSLKSRVLVYAFEQLLLSRPDMRITQADLLVSEGECHLGFIGWINSVTMIKIPILPFVRLHQNCFVSVGQIAHARIIGHRHLL